MTASFSRPFATLLATLMVVTLWLPTLDVPPATGSITHVTMPTVA